jgi:hypothetical protein
MMKPTYLSLLLALVLALPALATPTSLSVVTVSETAAALADNAADTGNGNRVFNGACDTVLLLRNTHASNSSTVTVAAQATSVFVQGYGLMTKANNAVTLAAGAVKHLGPFPCATWNDSSGYLQLTYSGTGTVLVSPVRVPK